MELRYIEKYKKFKLIDKNIVSIDIIMKKLPLKEKNSPKKPIKNKTFIKIKEIEKLKSMIIFCYNKKSKNYFSASKITLIKYIKKKVIMNNKATIYIIAQNNQLMVLYSAKKI